MNGWIGSREDFMSMWRTTRGGDTELYALVWETEVCVILLLTWTLILYPIPYTLSGASRYTGERHGVAKACGLTVLKGAATYLFRSKPWYPSHCGAARMLVTQVDLQVVLQNDVWSSLPRYVT